MDPNASRDARFEALQRAKQNSLDVAAIAIQTVRMILEDAFAVCLLSIPLRARLITQTIPALSGDQPDIASLATGLTEVDVNLIRSIEWLTMVPETMGEALVQSNAVARYFLGTSIE
jgi:nuclear pore complex protein Nup107